MEPAQDLFNCILCAEDRKDEALWPCGHGSVCLECCVRLRVIFADLNCPFCKSKAEDVIVVEHLSTEQAGSLGITLPRSYESIGTASRLRDDGLSMSFESRHLQAFAKQFVSIKCPTCVSVHTPRVSSAAMRVGRPRVLASLIASPTFASFDDLGHHVSERHGGRVFCHVCVGQRQVFPWQQRVYLRKALPRHMESGDAASGGEPAIPPHPHCSLCRHTSLTSDGLFAHLESRHTTCWICSEGGVGGHRCYVASPTSLMHHNRQHHYTCSHADCRHLTSQAFGTETELDSHAMVEHALGTAHGGAGANEVSLTARWAAEHAAGESGRTGYGPEGGNGPVALLMMVDTGLVYTAKQGKIVNALRAAHRAASADSSTTGATASLGGEGAALRFAAAAGSGLGAGSGTSSGAATPARAGTAGLAKQGSGGGGIVAMGVRAVLKAARAAAMEAFGARGADTGPVGKPRAWVNRVNALLEEALQVQCDAAVNARRADDGADAAAVYRQVLQWSGRFREGTMSASDYHRLLLGLLGPDGESELLPLLAALLPAAGQRAELKKVFVSHRQDQAARAFHARDEASLMALGVTDSAAAAHVAAMIDGDGSSARDRPPSAVASAAASSGSSLPRGGVRAAQPAALPRLPAAAGAGASRAGRAQSAAARPHPASSSTTTVTTAAVHTAPASGGSGSSSSRGGAAAGLGGRQGRNRQPPPSMSELHAQRTAAAIRAASGAGGAATAAPPSAAAAVRPVAAATGAAVFAPGTAPARQLARVAARLAIAGEALAACLLPLQVDSRVAAADLRLGPRDRSRLKGLACDAVCAAQAAALTDTAPLVGMGVSDSGIATVALLLTAGPDAVRDEANRSRKASRNRSRRGRRQGSSAAEAGDASTVVDLSSLPAWDLTCSAAWCEVAGEAAMSIVGVTAVAEAAESIRQEAMGTAASAGMGRAAAPTPAAAATAASANTAAGAVGGSAGGVVAVSPAPAVARPKRRGAKSNKVARKAVPSAADIVAGKASSSERGALAAPGSDRSGTGRESRPALQVSARARFAPAPAPAAAPATALAARHSPALTAAAPAVARAPPTALPRPPPPGLHGPAATAPLRATLSVGPPGPSTAAAGFPQLGRLPCAAIASAAAPLPGLALRPFAPRKQAQVIRAVPGNAARSVEAGLLGDFASGSTAGGKKRRGRNKR